MTKNELSEERRLNGGSSNEDAYYLGGYGAGLNGTPGQRPGAIAVRSKGHKIMKLLPLSESALDAPRLYAWQMGYLDCLGDNGYWDILQIELEDLNKEQWWIDLRRMFGYVES